MAAVTKLFGSVAGTSWTDITTAVPVGEEWQITFLRASNISGVDAVADYAVLLSDGTTRIRIGPTNLDVKSKNSEQIVGVGEKCPMPAGAKVQHLANATSSVEAACGVVIRSTL